MGVSWNDLGCKKGLCMFSIIRIKRFLKKTPAYLLYRRYIAWTDRRRMVSDLSQWTNEDESRKAFYIQFVNAGGLVFDVGANIGNRSKVFLALGARTGHP